MHLSISLCLVVFVFLSMSSSMSTPQPTSIPNFYPIDLPRMKLLLKDIMKCQNIRQLHVAAVHNGTELFQIKLDTLANGEIVETDKHMLLLIASVSKGMFTTALTLINHEIQRIINNPQFNLFTIPLKDVFGSDFWFLDHIRTELVKIDDVVSHSTGLRRHDTLWYLKYAKTKAEIMKATSRLNSSIPFRGSFVYNNLVWSMADLAVEKILKEHNLINQTGNGFVMYMRKFLWDKLGMNQTFSLSELQEDSHLELEKRIYKNMFASPDNSEHGSYVLQRNAVAVEAAGGIIMSLDDMVKYLQYHSQYKYSSNVPLPAYFQPLNAYPSTPTQLYDTNLFHDNITDIPVLETESYTRGWFRSRYRDMLNYNHGGTLFGVRCQLDVFPTRNLALFTHTNLGGDVMKTPFAGLFAVYINHYISDMLIKNSSFITTDNQCNMFNARLSNISQAISSVDRLNLKHSELLRFVGSYGNYGFGKVQVYYNQTSNLLNLVYGIGKIELYPVEIKGAEHAFFINLISPIDTSFGLAPAILNLTESKIYAYNSSIENNQVFASFIFKDNDVYLLSPALEYDMALKKDLDPNSWTRPVQCPSTDKKSRALHDSSNLVYFTVTVLVTILAIN